VNLLCKGLLATSLLVLFAQAHAAPAKETPPNEPPYTNDTEFDPLMGEDPAASSQIPVEPSQPTVQTPKPSAPAPAPAPIKKMSSYEGTTTTSELREHEYVPGSKPDKGVKLIHHPDGKKGLVRIEQDGTYVYQVKTTPKNQTGTVRFGLMDPPRITSADGAHTFADMYGSEPLPTILFEYEWQPFKKFGKLGVQGGASFSTAEGHGYFVSDGGQAREKYNFYAIPVNLGLVYRFEYFKKQWLAPYVAGGASYIGVAELRDDNKNNFSGVPAGYGAAGIMFNVSSLDKTLAFTLDSEYGVGNLWLVAEYRYIQAFSDTLDFTGGIMSLGISADF
jgi:hypothetical protein